MYWDLAGVYCRRDQVSLGARGCQLSGIPVVLVRLRRVLMLIGGVLGFDPVELPDCHVTQIALCFLQGFLVLSWIVRCIRR